MKKSLFLLVLISVLFISSCSNNSTGRTITNTVDTDAVNKAVQDFNEYNTEIIKDMSELQELLGKWNGLIEQRNKGVEIDNSDILRVGTEYRFKAVVLKTKINNFKDFLTKYEDQLEEANVDTFKSKQQLEVELVSIETNINTVEKSIENIELINSASNILPLELINDPSRFLPESCTIGPGFSCDEFIIKDGRTNDDAVTLIIRNGRGTKITNLDLRIQDDETGSDYCTLKGPSSILGDGESQLFTNINCFEFGDLGNRVRVRIYLSYIENGIIYNIVGMLNTKIESS